MIVAGFDYSITSPAVTVLDTQTGKYSFYAFRQLKKQNAQEGTVKLLQYPESSSDEQRYYLIAKTLLEAIKADHGTIPQRAFFELYAYSASGAVFNIAEATGLMKNMLWQDGGTIEKFAPTAVKKFATGKGNSKKHEMYSSFVSAFGKDPYEWFGLEYKGSEKIVSPINDLVDSYWVLQYGMSLMESSRG